jgi:hypothetical protein
MNETVFVLTKEEPDKSGFKICGTTDNPLVATTWKLADEYSGRTKVYMMRLNEFEDSKEPW